ncbi:hypothetical protein MMC32_005931 [Xylographa parallela]|nr:hypothetical protein [Xylographa parallela]
MDIDRFEHTGQSTSYYSRSPTNESGEHGKHLEERSDVYSSHNVWSYSTRYRPSSSSSLSSSTTSKAPENSPLRPISFTSPGTNAECQSPAFWETRETADKSIGKNHDRKEESRKAHKESERDRRNIENACIQQLKSLTHPECYMNVKSKYRDEPAKNEILARANAFIMALVLRLNAELSHSTALEQQILDLQRAPTTASHKPDDIHSVHLHEKQPDPHTTTHNAFPKPAHPDPFPLTTHLPPTASPPSPPTPRHCPAPNCHHSVQHFEAWYDSTLCRRWLDGPDGVLARTLAIVGVWHAGIAALVRAFERLQAAHPTLVPWNATALVGAFARVQAGAAPGTKAWDAEALVAGFEKTLVAKFVVEPASVEALVSAMGGAGKGSLAGGV